MHLRGEGHDVWLMLQGDAQRCGSAACRRHAAENGNPTNLGEVIDAIQDQRDILLAALEGMEKWASSIHDGYPPSTASIAAAPYREAARAAIASVKGPK